MTAHSTRESPYVDQLPKNSVAVASGDTFEHPVEIYVGTGGTVTVTTASGQTGVAFKVPSGGKVPVAVKAVTGLADSAADVRAQW